MASVRSRKRTDGTEYYSVLYRLRGKQTSTSFDDFVSASRFCQLANKHGPENALATLTVDTSLTSLTVEQWLTHHVDHLTGVDTNTVNKYRAYIRNDIAPVLGGLPLAGLTHDHVARWVQSMGEPRKDGRVASAGTISNKHGFLAGALNTAVPKHIASNPCSGIRLPRDDEAREMVFLTREEFAILRDSVTEYWRPLVEFLVASGCRWGEAVALKPADVDRAAGTVRISKSWKHGTGGYRLGAPKTPKSRRTINVPKATLDKLDYSNEWLFVNREGGPVRSHGFIRRVWAPAVKRSKLDPAPRIHDLRHTNASWQIQANVPLPVVQNHLGHESITTTVAIYGHLDRRSMQAAADAVGAALT